jgi:hypothetical protein
MQTALIISQRMLISEVNNRINEVIARGRWPRCEAVSLNDDGVLRYSLALDTYDLTEAYKSDLHIRFVNAETDTEVIEFVKSWGPLHAIWTAHISDPASSHLSDFRMCQRWLRAFMDLCAAFKKAKREHATLLEFVEAESELCRSRTRISPGLQHLRFTCGIDGSIGDWLKAADLQTVRNAADSLISIAWNPVRMTVSCRRERKRRWIETRYRFTDLEDALVWMVFNDEITKHLVMVCRECRKMFRVDSARVRKYCSNDCGHRATGRDWQRRKRKEERAAARRREK